MTVTNLRNAEHHYDRALPAEDGHERANDLRDEVREMLREPSYPAARILVTDEEIEKFITDLVAAPDADIFLENTVGALPRATSNELGMHMAIARQWVANKEAVGQIIGPIFWGWARQATYSARTYGWTADDMQVPA